MKQNQDSSSVKINNQTQSDKPVLPPVEPPKDPSWKEIFNLVKDYFVNSDEKLAAWLFLIGIIFCVVSLVALTAVMAWWSAGFWVILGAKVLAPFLLSLAQLALLITAFVVVHVVKDYLIGSLSILWRDWLTNKMTNTLLKGDINFLDLKRTNEIKHMAQRIQEDIKNFVKLTLQLSADFLKSTLSLTVFIGTLWVVGGALSFVLLGLNIVIPGYLVWVALIIAISATVITHFIGRSMPGINQESVNAEADFRQNLANIHDDAENIAVEHAENYYQNRLQNNIQNIHDTAIKKLNTQSMIIAFQNFYSKISPILPYLLAAPLYFTGLIELAQLMQVAASFAEVNTSMGWFVQTYKVMNTYKTSIKRIIELQRFFEEGGSQMNPKLIARQEQLEDTFDIEQLNMMKPLFSDNSHMMSNYQLKLLPNENTLIKGPSGLGKSIFFKALSGTWKYGNGQIAIPAGKTIYFLPQKPTLPHDTLEAALAYPESTDTYTPDQYHAALTTIGGMEQFMEHLLTTVKHDWAKTLSGGQQQLIMVARALLKKPDWLFLDEITSALDEDSEHRVYSVLSQLKDTTLVSIAHRNTVEKYHSRIVFFGADNKQETAELEVKCDTEIIHL